MKSGKLNKWVLAILLNALMFPVLAGVESPFEVGTWGNFCDGAMSITFDDWPNSGAKSIATTGKEAFNERNIPMTMFVNTNGMSSDNWGKLAAAFEDGHEVASHNHNHDSNQSGLQPSHDAIKQNVPGENAVSIAYPNCTPINSNEVLKYYIVGRTCASDMINSKSPSDMTKIQSKGFGSGDGNYPNSESAMNSYAQSAISQKGWGVQLHHGIGPQDNHSWATTDLNEMKKHLKYLDENRDKIWCETFGNVARYIKERDAVSLSVTSSDDNSITISVTDNLENSIFNYPLSIRRPLPDGWTDPVVTQDGEEVEFSVNNGYVMFKAVPDGGEVVISRDPVRALKHLSHKNSGSSPVVLKNSVLLIDQQYFNGSELAVTIFNLTGKMLGSYKTGKNESRIVLPAGKINRAAFVAKITGKDKTLIQKFMPQM
ncbi:MAG: polysaccharide deacetylase family protein [Fibrobacter sp.]|nr:polysaccharide deacetylase family protein [Fibrobacter sp.]